MACCQGVVTVIEATDGPQEERDMEDGETDGTHSAKNVSQSRPFCWFRWCQTLGQCYTRERRETIHYAEMARISTGVYTPQTCRKTIKTQSGNCEWEGRTMTSRSCGCASVEEGQRWISFSSHGHRCAVEIRLGGTFERQNGEKPAQRH